MPRLFLPEVAVHRSFVEAVAEFRAEGRGSADDPSLFGRDIREWGGRWGEEAGFAEYVTFVRELSLEETPRPPGWVPGTTWWWLEGDEFLGRITLRHRLNAYLLEDGGHIGYDMRPSARRRGHATAMLGAVLPIAGEMGIDPALLTCDVDNVGSRAVIEANGGVLEDERAGTLRFWVPTSA